MSKKMQLPDEILEAVSAGVLTYGGEPITSFQVVPTGKSGLIITLSGQRRIQLQWNEESWQRIQREPTSRPSKLMGEIREKRMSEELFDLEHYTSAIDE